VKNVFSCCFMEDLTTKLIIRMELIEGWQKVEFMSYALLVMMNVFFFSADRWSSSFGECRTLNDSMVGIRSC
jgi:hypothetical protein